MTKQRFSLRKTSLGVMSLMIGMSFLTSNPVKADEMTVATEVVLTTTAETVDSLTTDSDLESQKETSDVSDELEAPEKTLKVNLDFTDTKETSMALDHDGMSSESQKVLLDVDYINQSLKKFAKNEAVDKKYVEQYVAENPVVEIKWVKGVERPDFSKAEKHPDTEALVWTTEFSNGIYDINKKFDGRYRDDIMCSAAVATNFILWYLDQNKDNVAGYDKANVSHFLTGLDLSYDKDKHSSEIFNFFVANYLKSVFVENVVNRDFMPRYFKDVHPKTGEYDNVNSLVDATFNSRFGKFTREEFESLINKGLEEGKALAVSYYANLNETSAHIINVWGVDYTKDNKIAGIYVTDSDDNKSFLQNKTQQKDLIALKRYSIREKNGFIIIDTNLEEVPMGSHIARIITMDAASKDWEKYYKTHEKLSSKTSKEEKEKQESSNQSKTDLNTILDKTPSITTDNAPTEKPVLPKLEVTEDIQIPAPSAEVKENEKSTGSVDKVSEVAPPTAPKVTEKTEDVKGTEDSKVIVKPEHTEVKELTKKPEETEMAQPEVSKEQTDTKVEVPTSVEEEIQAPEKVTETVEKDVTKAEQVQNTPQNGSADEKKHDIVNPQITEENTSTLMPKPSQPISSSEEKVPTPSQDLPIYPEIKKPTEEVKEHSTESDVLPEKEIPTPLLSENPIKEVTPVPSQDTSTRPEAKQPLKEVKEESKETNLVPEKQTPSLPKEPTKEVAPAPSKEEVVRPEAKEPSKENSSLTNKLKPKPNQGNVSVSEAVVNPNRNEQGESQHPTHHSEKKDVVREGVRILRTPSQGHSAQKENAKEADKGLSPAVVLVQNKETASANNAFSSGNSQHVDQLVPSSSEVTSEKANSVNEPTDKTSTSDHAVDNKMSETENKLSQKEDKTVEMASSKAMNKDSNNMKLPILLASIAGLLGIFGLVTAFKKNK